jgi:hypothetical protein
MATMIIDDKLWYDAWLDTPLAIKRAVSREEAMKQPGCCVKSYERDGSWPRYTGKLTSYSDDLGERITVRGHGDAISPKFVWTGTKAEYYRTWDCD